MAPLAVRMRPRTLEEVLGQRHLMRPGSPLRKLAEPDPGSPAGPSSVILYGPPGIGKTTLALLAAGVAVDVVDIGVPDPMTRALAAMLLTLGALCPLLAFARWAMAERAMRRGEPLPSLGVSAAIVTGLVLVAAAALAVVVGTSR